jgi:hypothetical protein
MENGLHKALKHKAIESDKTLHSYIIETLSATVQERSVPFGISNNEVLEKGRDRR